MQILEFQGFQTLGGKDINLLSMSEQTVPSDIVCMNSVLMTFNCLGGLLIFGIVLIKYVG